MIGFLRHLMDRLSALFVALMCVGIAVMTLINCFNITWRALFDSEPGPILPWTIVIFVWTVFLGFFPLVHEGRDVSIEFVRDRVSGTVLFVLDVVSDVIMVVVALLIFSQVGKIVSMQVGTLPMIGFERYWLSVPLFISCALISADVSLRLVCRLLNRGSL